MSLFKRVLNAGEGRKLKLLESIVPEINALEPDMERLSDDELRGPDRRVPSAVRAGRGPRRDARGGLRDRPRGRASGSSASGTSTSS